MKKNVIYLALLCVFIMGIGLVVLHNNFSLRTVATDSGWDSSYDSGGGWDSGGSSWDSSSSDYGSGGSSITPEESLLILEVLLCVFLGCGVLYSTAYPFSKVFKDTTLVGIVVCFAFLLIMALYIYLAFLIDSIVVSLFTSVDNHVLLYFLILCFTQCGITLYCYIKDFKKTYCDCSDEKLLRAGITDKRKTKDELYKNFVDVQNAWMDFDYKTLSKLCSDELYNSYKSDLEILKQKNGKNIMRDFTLRNIAINSVSFNGEYVCLRVFLHVGFYDYVINESTGEVIRGNKNNFVDNKYILEYTKKIKTRKKCPSCDCKILDGDIVCPACGTNIINNSSKFVLTHKEKIN